MSKTENKISRDVRNHPKYDELLKKLGQFPYRPLVGIYDLEEVIKVVKILPGLKFPINCAGELIDKLAGSSKELKFENVKVDPVRMIKYMPAYYFPIQDMGNFIEKMGELIRGNRHSIDVPKQIESIRREVYAVLKYPIKDSEVLVKQLSSSRRQFTYQGRVVDIDRVAKRIPKEFFPVESEHDFFSKVKTLLVNRPLIEPHVK
jgi:hypothetical protein